MKSISLTVLAVSFVLTAPHAVADNHQPIEAAATTQTMVTAKVNGMDCDFCAWAVTKVFGKEDVVENVHIDLDNGEIHVTLKSGADMSDAEVEKLVKKSGYDLVSVGRESL